LDALDEGVFHTDRQLRLQSWNRAAVQITGHEFEAVAGKHCRERLLCHVDARGRELCLTSACPLADVLASGRVREDDIFLHHREGHLVAVSVRTLRWDAPDGSPGGLIQVFRPRVPGDQRREDLQEWKKAALTDALTGLGNRRAFRQAWTKAHRALVTKGIPFGILMVDIDLFKKVNDTWGHPVGDKVLKMVARTLAASVRKADAVIRWGGEEFLVLVAHPSPEGLADLAERIRQLVERGWVQAADGTHLGVTVSVGGALAAVGERPTDVVSRADGRLYECKATGRNRTLTGS